MRVPRLVVQGVALLVAFFVVLSIVGTRHRTDRAIRIGLDNEQRGNPSEINLAATQQVSVWAGQPASVIAVVGQPHDLWLATAMVGPDCYQITVGAHGEKVSAHPGLIPCPGVEVAGSGEDKVDATDDRHTLVSLYLDSWLRGDKTSSRFLADSTAAIPPPAELASDVKVLFVWGRDVPTVEGTRSWVTAQADVKIPTRVESLAWTFELVRGPTRWSIAAVSGGEVPSGDPTELRLGRTPDTTPPSASEGD